LAAARVSAVVEMSTAVTCQPRSADTVGVGGRIEFTHADLRDKPPAEEAYDLVSAQFMHLPPEQRRELFDRLAAAVAPGGVLLIVGHHPSDLWTTARRMHMPDMMYTAQDVAAGLDPSHWDVLTAEARPRPATDPDGHDVTIHDAVLLARRR
ncbi:class I SAM-dependent methyltransferase, partial [Micromonospora taraxaci]|uniref:class I SAM-dependent methyltransferase n=1 Tax=Micromonospora taraxaci TaxID=1316803 RepID=UPI0033D8E96C